MVTRSHVRRTSAGTETSSRTAPARNTEQSTPLLSAVRPDPESGFRADFARVPIHAARVAGPSTLDLLTRAADEPAQSLPAPLQMALGNRLSADFSNVRVHAGPASGAAAERLGAMAYTLGHRIHLGSGTTALSGTDRECLLAHEAVHAAQQGFRPVVPRQGVRVGRPDTAAEAEARSTAAMLRAPSASLALRDRFRVTAVRYPVEPQIQRDLKKTFEGLEGDFKVDLKTESHPGAKSGMSGTIKFKPNAIGDDSTSIKLLQIARDEDLDTGKEYVWTGDEANRNKIMTTAAPDLDPGYFVDMLHKGLKPRASKADTAISPYYMDTVPGTLNRAGSKKGKAITEASLWDYPGSSGKRRFSFETAAKATDTGHIYATLTWGFTLSDPAKGKVENEHAALHEFASKTFKSAVTAFDEFYKNPGASTAPK